MGTVRSAPSMQDLNGSVCATTRLACSASLITPPLRAAGPRGGRVRCSAWTMRAARWQARRAAGRLDDAAPGGHRVHCLLDWERAAIVGLCEAWGEPARLPPLRLLFMLR